jgi:hypothetical protein
VLISIPLLVLAFVTNLLLFEITHPLLSYGAGLMASALFEEAIKLRAAKLETSGIRAFALVSLFGIFELAFFKPLVIWDIKASGEEIFWLQALLLPALAMHVLTAAIYAFHFRNRPVVQFAICVTIHFSFNLIADYSSIVSPLAWLMSIFPLAGLAWWLVPKRGSAERGRWQIEQAATTAI